MAKMKGVRKGKPPRLRRSRGPKQVKAVEQQVGSSDLSVGEPVAAYASADCAGVSCGSVRPLSQDALIARFHPQIAKIVNGVMSAFHYPKRLFEDCFSAGCLGLVEAAARYDPNRRGRFSTFVFSRVRGSVIDYIRTNSEIPRPVYRRIRALELVTNLRLAEEGSSQVCFADPRAEAIDMVSKAAIAYRLMMSQGDDPYELASISQNPEHIALTRALSRQVRIFVEELPEVERTIIERIYFFDRTMSEVAAEDVGLSLSRVSRCHDRVLGALRDRMLAWEDGRLVNYTEQAQGASDEDEAGEVKRRPVARKRTRRRRRSE